MPDVIQATADYEAWLGRQVRLVTADLALKHRLMEASVLPFLRGTFYRWVALWHELCPELVDAPRLLAVGDLHVENFGTWRDAEGRLIWGVNDVDEAAPMPYAIDLVRLAASALLACEAAHFTLPAKTACKSIIKGYRRALEAGGRAFVLEEHHHELRRLALSAEREPERYWAKLAAFRRIKAPEAIKRLLAAHLPGPLDDAAIVHRIAGIGGLGLPRYTALGLFEGGYVAREVKALLPSAYGGATGRSADRLYGAAIIKRAVRSPDPFLTFKDRWLVRRLGPHCSRIELAMLPKEKDERLLLEAMGWETANLHLGSPGAAPRLKADLRRRPSGWLLAAATRMAKATRAEWKEWRSR